MTRAAHFPQRAGLAVPVLSAGAFHAVGATALKYHRHVVGACVGLMDNSIEGESVWSSQKLQVWPINGRQLFTWTQTGWPAPESIWVVDTRPRPRQIDSAG